MKRMPTRGKARFVLPELIECRDRLYSPKVELTNWGNILIFESVDSTDEDICETCGQKLSKEKKRKE